MSMGKASYGQDVQIMSLQLDPGRIAANTGKVQIMNHQAEALQVVMSLQVMDINRSILLERKTDPIALQQGLNIYDLSDIAEAVRQFSHSTSESRIPSEICLEILGGMGGTQSRTSSLLAAHCERIYFSTTISSTLLYPFDNEVIPNSNVIFTWAPTAMSRSQNRYTLTVVELPTDVPEANLLQEILQRPAHFQQADILTTLLAYPAHAPRLEAGKSYAWFVQLANAEQVLANSQIRRLSVAAESLKQADEPVNLPFVDLKRKNDASIYPAMEAVRFKFPNRYGENDLNIQIIATNGDHMEIQAEWVEDLGHDLYELKLPLSAGFEAGASYEMHIHDKQQGFYRIKFRYHLKNRKPQN